MLMIFYFLLRCSKCGNESEASSKIEDFYEIELNVKGLKNLDESLDDYLSIEELREDNQYYCDACAMRVDAMRSIKLRSLPAVLNFQLKRCVFLPNVIDLFSHVCCFYFFHGVIELFHWHTSLLGCYSLYLVEIYWLLLISSAEIMYFTSFVGANEQQYIQCWYAILVICL